MERERSLLHVQEGNSDVTRSWNSATRQYRQVNATQGKRRNNLHFGTSYHSKRIQIRWESYQKNFMQRHVAARSN